MNERNEVECRTTERGVLEGHRSCRAELRSHSERRDNMERSGTFRRTICAACADACVIGARTYREYWRDFHGK